MKFEMSEEARFLFERNCLYDFSIWGEEAVVDFGFLEEKNPGISNRFLNESESLSLLSNNRAAEKIFVASQSMEITDKVFDYFRDLLNSDEAEKHKNIVIIHTLFKNKHFRFPLKDWSSEYLKSQSNFVKQYSSVYEGGASKDADIQTFLTEVYLSLTSKMEHEKLNETFKNVENGSRAKAL